MTILFLNLPVELQIEVVNNISLYSDLKALCLVSKALNNIATPKIYYQVDLRIGDLDGEVNVPNEAQDQRMLSRIRSLLVKPANLGFLKVLKTGWIGDRPTILMIDYCL